MCPPTHFAVRYRINPWMHPDRPVDTRRAIRQWQHLYGTLRALGHDITLIDPHPALPDMVFAANGGIVIGDRALVPRFRFVQRADESDRFRSAFAAAGIGEIRVARFLNEGEGDFRVVGGRILAGTGLRSEPDAVAEVADYFGLPVVRLTLVDPRLYHLDTALAVLDDDTVVYWPDAFDATSRAALAQLYPDAVLAGEADALSLALNVVSDGDTAIVAPGHDRLTGQIRERGFSVVTVATDELRKAGGGAKCCVLEWHRPPGRPLR
jgi:N-dimethylarginine dimethylaminohydrolase